MTQITLTTDQALLLGSAESTLLVCDPNGQVVGILSKSDQGGLSPKEPRPRSGAELVSYWQETGLVGTRPDIVDAPEHARALRQAAEHRERP